MRGLAAAGACSALLLTACSGDPEPPQTLPPLSSPTASASPVPTPSGINAPDAFGASAFTKAYFAELSKAFDTLSVDRLREMSQPGCTACQRFISVVERVATSGGRFEGADFSLAFAEAPPPEKGDVVVDLRYSVSETREFDSSGRVVRTDEPRVNVNAQLRAQYAAGTWTVRGIRDVAT